MQRGDESQAGPVCVCVCQTGKRAMFSPRSLLLEQSLMRLHAKAQQRTIQLHPAGLFFFKLCIIKKIECKYKQIGPARIYEGKVVWYRGICRMLMEKILPEEATEIKWNEIKTVLLGWFYICKASWNEIKQKQFY